jgi:TetR/AcrR family transcriptional regulator, tetracycline repressor protein
MNASPTRARAVEAANRPGLTRDQIVDVAVALVDAEGLERLTLRRLADHLGVTPMALYWHFRDKEALLAALGERLFSSIVYPEHAGAWSDELDAVLRAVLDSLRQHPAVAPLAVSTVLTTPAGLVLSERVLSMLCDAGLDDATAANVGGFLLHSVVALVTSVPGEVKTSTLSPDVALGDYPVAVRLAPHLVACDDVDGFLGQGVDVLIEGVRGLVAQRA